ncbi:phosphotransferase enzyme family protein [Luteolibacter sp. AS25]|uniref:phosphotransferase enzyme family protein n=1 Tax=Luteolibacter sp. AS25 TaxID=3135776 RepID=UPI00398B1820
MPLSEIASRFVLPGPVVSHEEIPTGLINSTYVVGCIRDEVVTRFILQSINSTVFMEPENVMENVLNVTNHLAQKNEPENQLRLIPTHEGNHWLELPDRTIWRCYPFQEGTESFTEISSPALAFRAAAAFGDFQAKLADLDPRTLHDTIPDFHNTPAYLLKLEDAARHDICGRLAEVEEELEFIRSQKPLTSLLVTAGLPQRITHNDTKISNILFPKSSGIAPTVIDLDTVMPGLALYDFGDLVRSAAATAAEDETDPGKIFIDPEMQKALTEGYLSTASSFLSEKEIELLPASVSVITLELAMRFLTDYLLGDKYFRSDYAGHNLVRARNQLTLLKSILVSQ